MKLIGLSKNTSPHFAKAASHFVDLSHVDPDCSARRSTTRNPTLWRVPAYSGPGFPKPAIKRICGAFSSTSAQSAIRNPRSAIKITFSALFLSEQLPFLLELLLSLQVPQRRRPRPLPSSPCSLPAQ